MNERTAKHRLRGGLEKEPPTSRAAAPSPPSTTHLNAHECTYLQPLGGAAPAARRPQDALAAPARAAAASVLPLQVAYRAEVEGDEEPAGGEEDHASTTTDGVGVPSAFQARLRKQLLWVGLGGWKDIDLLVGRSMIWMENKRRRQLPVRPQAQVVFEEGDEQKGQGEERHDDEGLLEPAREDGEGLLLHDPGVDGPGHDCGWGCVSSSG